MNPISFKQLLAILYRIFTFPVLAIIIVLGMIFILVFI